MNFGKHLRTIIIATFATFAAFESTAISMADIRFNNIDVDTTRINTVLEQHANEWRSNKGTLVDNIAMDFIGTPYAAQTLESSPEMLTVDMEKFDCTTFVETILALAMTTEEGRTSWRDFAYHLKSLRYRDSTVDGYGSRLHYISDWIVDNTHKGLVEEVTGMSELASREIRTLDFMSHHRDKYPMMKEDDQAFEKVRNVEMGYRSHSFPYFKSRHIPKFEFKNGDVVFFVTGQKDLDVVHAGLIHMKDGVPYVLHASSSAKEVALEKAPLTTFMKRRPNYIGVRIVRLK